MVNNEYPITSNAYFNNLASFHYSFSSYSFTTFLDGIHKIINPRNLPVFDVHGGKFMVGMVLGFVFKTILVYYSSFLVLIGTLFIIPKHPQTVAAHFFLVTNTSKQ